MPPTIRRAAAIVFCVATIIAESAHAQNTTPGAVPPVLVSRQLAKGAQVAVGDLVTFAADADGRSGKRFRVVGIYEPTPDPLRFTVERIEARMHLPDIVSLAADPADRASMDAVDAINLKLAKPVDIDHVSADLATRMPGLEVRPTSRPAEGDPFAVLDRFHLAISLVTVAGSTAFLLALMIIRADERRETIGAMRLIGISRRSLLVEVAVEGLIIACAGAVIGLLIGVGAQRLVNRVFQARYDTTLVFLRLTPSIAVRSIAVAVPLGIAAGIAASWTLLRRNILSLVGR
jgi:putative ABC transport system permease protein